jgi:hypothetical protein
LGLVERSVVKGEGKSHSQAGSKSVVVSDNLSLGVYDSAVNLTAGEFEDICSSQNVCA